MLKHLRAVVEFYIVFSHKRHNLRDAMMNWEVRLLHKYANAPRVLHAAVLGLVMGLVWVSSSYAQELTIEEREWLRAHDGKITLAPSDSYPPLDYYDKFGGHRGIAADYFRLIEQRLGFRFKRVRLGTWENILAGGRQNRFDVTTLAQRTEAREGFWRFSKPYIHVPAALIAKKTTTGELTLSSLSGQRVAVVDGYAVIESALTQIPSIELVKVADDISGLLKVSFGEADVMVTELPVALYHIDQSGIMNLRVAGSTGFSYDYSIASRIDSPILHRILEKGLAQISAAERKRIERRWIRLGDWEKLQEQPLGWLGRLTVLILILVTLLGFYFWRVLKRREIGQALQMKATRGELQSIFEASASGFGLLDSEGFLLRANPALLRFLKLFESEDPLSHQLMGQAWFKKQFFAARDDPSAANWRSKFSLNSTVQHYDLALIPITTAGQESQLLLRVDDVTELQFKSFQIEQEKKMRSLGTLAGGIAHDFNNVLGVLAGNLTIIERRLSKQEMVTEFGVSQGLQNIGYATRSAGELTKKLMDLSSQGNLKRLPVQANQFLVDLVEFSKASLSSSVQTRLDLTTEPLVVLVDKIELERTLLNLIVNANHAMSTMRSDDKPSGGVITVGLSRFNESERLFGKLSIDIKKAYCIIKVSDTGVGMSDATRRRAFEPYFSTKVEQGGTGLGLATAYRVVTEHGGSMVLESELGIGSTLNVILPIAQINGFEA